MINMLPSNYNKCSHIWGTYPDVGYVSPQYWINTGVTIRATDKVVIKARSSLVHKKYSYWDTNKSIYADEGELTLGTGVGYFRRPSSVNPDEPGYISPNWPISSLRYSESSTTLATGEKFICSYYFTNPLYTLDNDPVIIVTTDGGLEVTLSTQNNWYTSPEYRSLNILYNQQIIGTLDWDTRVRSDSHLLLNMVCPFNIVSATISYHHPTAGSGTVTLTASHYLYDTFPYNTSSQSVNYTIRGNVLPTSGGLLEGSVYIDLLMKFTALQEGDTAVLRVGDNNGVLVDKSGEEWGSIDYESGDFEIIIDNDVFLRISEQSLTPTRALFYSWVSGAYSANSSVLGLAYSSIDATSSGGNTRFLDCPFVGGNYTLEYLGNSAYLDGQQFTFLTNPTSSWELRVFSPRTTISWDPDGPGWTYKRYGPLRLSDYVYSIKIYDSNDNLIHDFIPAYSQSLSQYGLYDLYTDVFSGSPEIRGVIKELISTEKVGIKNNTLLNCDSAYIKANGQLVEINKAYINYGG